MQETARGHKPVTVEDTIDYVLVLFCIGVIIFLLRHGNKEIWGGKCLDDLLAHSLVLRSVLRGETPQSQLITEPDRMLRNNCVCLHMFTNQITLFLLQSDGSKGIPMLHIKSKTSHHDFIVYWLNIY